MDFDRYKRRFKTVVHAGKAASKIYGRERSLASMIKGSVRIMLWEGLGGFKSRIITLAFPPPPSGPAEPTIDYEAWHARFDSLGAAQLQAARAHASRLDLPDVLILVVVTRDALPHLAAMAASWSDSVHAGWRAALIAAPDLSAEELDLVRAVVETHPAAVLLETPGEAAALRERYSHTLLTFGPVLLNGLTLYMMLEAAIRTGADLVYSDNDHLDAAGRRVDPAFKPQMSPELLSHVNYIGDCVLLSRSVPVSAADAGLLAGSGVEGWDALLARLTPGRQVEHVPFLLFHAMIRRARAVHNVAPPAPGGPRVCIIIPTRNGLAYLRQCIGSIVERTNYPRPDYELLVIDNRSDDPQTLDYLAQIRKQDGISVLSYPHPFNFSAVNNLGAANTTAEILVFLNNDTIVHDADWLGKLVHHALLPGVGVVGAKLLFPDGTIQHGGCAAGVGMGTVQHLLTNLPAEAVAATDHTREMALMTGACYAMRRAVFEAVGGFDPILQITWNDVKLCLDCLQAGYRNIYVADPLLIHDESKTRGQDLTREHMARYFDEAHYTRKGSKSYFYDDPSYNPNLSVRQSLHLAEPPRVRRPWAHGNAGGERILVLSSTYKFGFGVPLVIQQHVARLVELGYRIVIGGPEAEKEFDYPGCERVVIGSSQEAAVLAFASDVSLIIAHTAPFFELPVLIGGHIPVISYDYGEPSADFFPDPTRSFLLAVEQQKRSSAALTTVLATISQAVKDETLNNDAVVVGLANSHLPAWSDAMGARREQTRRRHRWGKRFVVLTVCRFSENERAYKGLTFVARILREFPYLHPTLAQPVTWVLVGAGSPDDVRQVEALGFTVFPNVPDEELIDLYTAADAYMSFSRWEGYNLGISQALAMGLPTLASDIPAHREFPIKTTGSVLDSANWLAEQVRAGRAEAGSRDPVIYRWEDSAGRFAELVARVLRDSATAPRRDGFGRSAQRVIEHVDQSGAAGTSWDG